MKKRPAGMKIRVEFEPNRFSSDYLERVYEHIKPVDTRTISNERQEAEESSTKAAMKGGEK